MGTVSKGRTLATVLSVAAIAVAAGGTGAVANGLVTSHDIKNHTIHAVDLANGAVGSPEIKNHSVQTGDLAPTLATKIAAAPVPGPQGPRGLPGVPGVQGIQGIQGPAAPTASTFYTVETNPGDSNNMGVVVPTPLGATTIDCMQDGTYLLAFQSNVQEPVALWEDDSTAVPNVIRQLVSSGDTRMILDNRAYGLRHLQLRESGAGATVQWDVYLDGNDTDTCSISAQLITS